MKRLLRLLSVILVLYFSLAFGIKKARADPPTPVATPTITPTQEYKNTSTPETPATPTLDTTPHSLIPTTMPLCTPVCSEYGTPIYWGTVTPSIRWKMNCHHCIPTNTPLSTSTPIGIQPTIDLTSSPTAVYTPGLTATYTPTINPTCSPDTNIGLFVVYPNVNNGEMNREPLNIHKNELWSIKYNNLIPHIDYGDILEYEITLQHHIIRYQEPWEQQVVLHVGDDYGSAPYQWSVYPKGDGTSTFIGSKMSENTTHVHHPLYITLWTNGGAATEEIINVISFKINGLELESGCSQLTPTPGPTSTPNCQLNTYCLMVEDYINENNEIGIGFALPDITYQNVGCYTIFNGINASIGSYEISLPSITFCVKMLSIGVLKILNIDIDMNLMMTITFGYFILKTLLRT